MAKVFISYRRADSAATSGRIYDHLKARFGQKNIFKDVDNIPPGVDFLAYIQQSLGECAVALVIIGREWLDIRGATGARRLDDPGDFVRVEIETALRLGVAVVPVLVDGAIMPPAERLPESLRPLVRLNALPVRHDPDFARDMERVIAGVERLFAERAPTGGLLGRIGGNRAPTPAKPAPMPQAVPQAAVAAPPQRAPVSRPIPAQPTRAKSAARPGASGQRVMWRPLMGVAGLLLVISFVGLLAPGLIGKLKGSGQGTPTLDAAGKTSTAVANNAVALQKTQTAVRADLFPYGPVAPGTDCDPKYVFWQGNTELSSPATCVAANGSQPAMTHLAVSPQPLCVNSRCAAEAGITYDLSTFINLPADLSYTISVQSRNLSPTANLDIDLFVDADSGNIRAVVSVATGRCDVLATLPGQSTSTIGSTSFANGTAAHTYAYRLTASSFAFLLDGHQVAFHSIPTNGARSAKVFLDATTTNSHDELTVDWSSFSIAA